MTEAPVPVRNDTRALSIGIAFSLLVTAAIWALGPLLARIEHFRPGPDAAATRA